MQGIPALVTLAFAMALAVPAACAQGSALEAGASADASVAASVPPSLDGAAAGVVDADPLADPSLAAPLGRAVDEVGGLAGDPIDVSLSVQAQADARGDAGGLSPSREAASPPSFGERVGAVAVPVAGAGLLAAALGAAAFGLEALRALFGRALRGLVSMAGALPLFSRIERGGALDNPVRARVHEAISHEPGLSLSDVAQRAGIAWGTAVHHLRRLESLGLVVSQSGSAHRRFFIANTSAAAQRTAVVAVMHPTARRIAEYVTQRPGTDQAGLCQALGLNNPAASKHLGRFESRGLVLSQRSGRSRLYHATEGLHSALLLLGQAAPIVVAARAPSEAAAPRLVTVGAT
jgi:DNA-binding MarR family transcriptional regulator